MTDPSPDVIPARDAAEPPVIILAGPTASGKSALALELAGRLTPAGGAVVINADSMQVYRELRVLTARPAPEDEARAPHRLFGTLPGSERCSAGKWLGLAVNEIGAARAAGKVPLVVGGTGLYIKALLEGLAPVPDVPGDVVARLTAQYDSQGGDSFRAALAEVDPEAASKLPPGDKQRLIRARAVVEATGKTLAAWQAESPAEPPVSGPFVVAALVPERARLYAACDARFDAMLDAGALDEVAALLRLGLDPSLPVMRAVGVPALAAHLAGDLPLDAAAAKARQATRNLAKRQLTWLRHQITPDVVLAPGEEADWAEMAAMLHMRISP